MAEQVPLDGMVYISAIGEVVGIPYGDSVIMSELYKGGQYFPDIAENANIPTAGEMRIQNFRGGKKGPSIPTPFRGQLMERNGTSVSISDAYGTIDNGMLCAYLTTTASAITRVFDFYRNSPSRESPSTSAIATLTQNVNNNRYAALVVKTNKSGEHQWTSMIHCNVNPIRISGIVQAPNGSIYAVAYYTGTPLIHHGSSNGVHASTYTHPTQSLFASAPSAMVIHYNSSGIVQWVTLIKTTGSSTFAYASCTYTDDNGVIIGFERSGGFDIYDSTGVLTSLPSGSRNIVFMKFNNNGTYGWRSEFSGSFVLAPSNPYNTDESHVVVKRSRQANSGIFVSFYITGNTTISSTAPGWTNISGTQGSLLVQLKQTGEVALNASSNIWRSRITQTNTTYVTDVCVLNNNDVYVTGYTSAQQNVGIQVFSANNIAASASNLIFGTQTTTLQKGFIVKLDSNGNYSGGTYVNSTVDARAMYVTSGSNNGIISVGTWNGVMTPRSFTGVNYSNVTSTQNTSENFTNNVYVHYFSSNGTLDWTNYFQCANGIYPTELAQTNNYFYVAGNYATSSSNESQFVFHKDKTGHSTQISSVNPNNNSSMSYFIRIPADGFMYESNTGLVNAPPAPPITLSNITNAIVPLQTMFTSSNGQQFEYTIVHNPLSNVTLVNNTLVFTNDFRARTYYIIVRATDISTSNYAENSLVAVERIPPNPILQTALPVQYLGNRLAQINLCNYINGSNTPNGVTFTITGNPQNSATISNNILYVQGNYRATQYNITVEATNKYGGKVSTSMFVSENKEFELLDAVTSSSWKYDSATQRIRLNVGTNMCFEPQSTGVTLGTGGDSCLSYRYRDNLSGLFLAWAGSGNSRELTLSAGASDFGFFSVDSGSNWVLHHPTTLPNLNSTLPFEGWWAVYNSNTDRFIINQWANKLYREQWIIRNKDDPTTNTALAGSRYFRQNRVFDSNAIVRMPPGPFWVGSNSLSITHPVLGPTGSNIYRITTADGGIPENIFLSDASFGGSTIWFVSRTTMYTGSFTMEFPIPVKLQNYNLHTNLNHINNWSWNISEWSLAIAMESNDPFTQIDFQTGVKWRRDYTNLANGAPRHSFTISSSSNEIPFKFLKLTATPKQNGANYQIWLEEAEFYVKIAFP